VMMSSLEIEKTIRVIIYSYKGKKLQSVIENLQNTASGYNKITYDVWDQYPLIRDKTVGALPDIMRYQYIFWDHITSPSRYIQTSISSSQEEYVLLLADNMILSQNWDSTFISMTNGKKAIISGQGKTTLLQKDLFFLEEEVEETQQEMISNWINKDLIFCKKSYFLLLQYPQYLKHFGINEVLSASAFCHGLDVISLPSGSFTKIFNETVGVLYTPFSVKHNYNEAINLIKTGSNRFVNLNNLERTVRDFASFHSISVDRIKPLPFLQDDVQYDPHQTPFDKIDSRKFMTKIHYI